MNLSTLSRSAAVLLFLVGCAANTTPSTSGAEGREKGIDEGTASTDTRPDSGSSAAPGSMTIPMPSSCTVVAAAEQAARRGIDSHCALAAPASAGGDLDAPMQLWFASHDDLARFDSAISEPRTLLRENGFIYPVRKDGATACFLSVGSDVSGWVPDSASGPAEGRWKAAFEVRAALAKERSRPACDFVVFEKLGQYTFVGFMEDYAFWLASVDGGFGKFTAGKPLPAAEVFAAIR